MFNQIRIRPMLIQGYVSMYLSRMTRSLLITTTILIAIGLSNSGCQSGFSSSLSKSMQRPYDYESHILHAECSLLPAGQDSIDVYVEWDRKECLYLRDNPSSPFFTHLSIEIGRHQSTWRDTLFSGMEQQGRRQWRLDREEILGIEPSGAAQVGATFTDHHRNSSFPWTASIPEPQLLAPAYSSDGWSLFHRQVLVGDTIYFSAPADSRWQHASVEVPHRLPAPPFTSGKDRTDTLQPLVRSDWTIDASGWSGYIIQSGINVMGRPNGSGQLDVAHVIHGVDFDFPHVRDIRQLISASRYITTRSEFQRMEAASDPKAALDAFWLNCGNEQTAAAELIKIYYNRVEEANRFFSGVIPGWKTDRGMVHIVFGVPDKIRRTTNSEWWLYGEEGTANAINMRFLKRDHPWDPNFYELGRSIQYRAPWDRMVTNWRNGRIQPD